MIAKTQLRFFTLLLLLTAALTSGCHSLSKAASNTNDAYQNNKHDSFYDNSWVDGFDNPPSH